MDKIKQKLCGVQGRLFVDSLQAGYESEPFIRVFMRSCVAKALDSEYNRMQWAGEAYLLEELQEEASIRMGEKTYDKESLFWMGYVYRYWHFYTGESSKMIVRIAPVRTLHKHYREFQGQMEPDGLIDRFRESYFQGQEEKI